MELARPISNLNSFSSQIQIGDLLFVAIDLSVAGHV